MAYTVMMVVAAGRSTRMGCPKQQLVLANGKTVLMTALKCFQETDGVDGIVLVTRQEDKELFREQAEKEGITKLLGIALGGDTRMRSVANGLALVPEKTELLGIHDGARPLITSATVEKVIAVAAESGAAAVGVPVKDTLKRTDSQGVITDTLSRDNAWRVQTPQVFRCEAYRQAMEKALREQADYTDDCRLMEREMPVVMVPGQESNLKITVPDDVPLANALLEQRKERKTMRIGHGYDVHRLTDNRPLILGGVSVPFEKGLLGHSDADVLTHAIMDALLGAAALGDIGELFPDTDPAYEGADSMQLLAEVVRRIKEKGYSIDNIDATVLAQKPKLKPFIPAMRERIACVCGLDSEEVSVKATTEEGLGFTGAMEGIAAHSVCLLKKEE